MVTKKKSKAKVTHTARLDPELNDLFEQICDSRNQSYDSAINEAIVRWVAENATFEPPAAGATDGNR